MITLDCPFCDGPASTDERLLAIDCETCGTSIAVASDPSTTRILAAAA